MALVHRSTQVPLTAEEHVGRYGRGHSVYDGATGEHFIAYDPGVLHEHLASFEAAGGRVRWTGYTTWAVLPDGRAFRVVCGEIIPIVTEDGPSDGRCGAPVVAGAGCCERHLPVCP